MLAIRRSRDRGHANHGWLDSYHTFSFADYHDPAFMGFRALRVINEDRIAGGQGFGTHPHRDMEIITYMLDGELAHKDSMGNGHVIKTGEVQGMSAGTGITHSEFNALKDRPAHLLQIWIMPHTKSVKPAYGEWYASGAERAGWALVASDDENNGSIRIHQDVRLYLAKAETGKTLDIDIKPGRYGWLQIAKGEAEINGQTLFQGDGVAFESNDIQKITAKSNSEFLLFDLA